MKEDSNVILTFLRQGLSVRVRLLRSLPSRYKVDLNVKEGTHQSEGAGASFLPVFNSSPMITIL